MVKDGVIIVCLKKKDRDLASQKNLGIKPGYLLCEANIYSCLVVEEFWNQHALVVFIQVSLFWVLSQTCDKA